MDKIKEHNLKFTTEALKRKVKTFRNALQMGKPIDE